MEHNVNINNIITILATDTPDTLADDKTLNALVETNKMATAKGNTELAEITGSAIELMKQTIGEHLERLVNTTDLVNKGSITGWIIAHVGKNLNGDVVSFDNGGVGIRYPHIYRSYDEVKAELVRDIKDKFSHYTADVLNSGADWYGASDNDMNGPFYRVSDHTDLGHDWALPIIDYRLADSDEFVEVYVTPIKAN